MSARAVNDRPPREGEIALPFDPAETADDARVIFIGRIRSPWKTRGECPRNLSIARERGQAAVVEIDGPWRPGLAGLEQKTHIILAYWMDQAPRNLIVQAPRHGSGPRGVFALRSPARPNPVALATVRLTGLDIAAGVLNIDAIDCLDRTPLVDIKPWIGTIDQAGD